MFRTAPLAQCITDDRCRIVAVDDAYVAILGRTRTAMLGRSPLDFTAPADRAVNHGLVRTLDLAGRAFTMTKRYVRGDGTLQWVRVHASAFSDGAGARLFLGTCEATGRPDTPLAQVRHDAMQLVQVLSAAKRAFGVDVMTLPALEALLHLHLAELEGRSLTPRCIASLLRQSEPIALRWTRVLEQRGLVEVERDIGLGGASPLRITVRAQQMMEAVCARS